MNRFARYISFLFSIMPLCLFATTTTEADNNIQDQGSNNDVRYFTVGSIDVIGVDDPEKRERILLCLGKKVGDSFDIQDYSFINTFKENVFSKCTFVRDYTLTYSTDADIIRLYINVTMAPLIKDIVARNAKGDDDLLEKIKGKKYANDNILQKLNEAFGGNEDFEQVELIVKAKNNSDAETCIEIEKVEREKTYINLVSFVGNDNITSKELLSSLHLTGKDISLVTFLRDTYASFKFDMSFLRDRGQKLLTFFMQKSKKTLSKKYLKSDLNSILNKYYSCGFLNARIKKLIINYDKENCYCDITYVIDEGERFYVGDYDVSNTKPYNSLFLKSVLGIHPGDVFDIRTIRKKVFGSQENMYFDGIKVLFNRAGYNNCYFSIIIKRIVGNKVYFYIDIREGSKEMVGEITVKGNVNTSFKHFLSDSSLLPNTFYSSVDMLRTQQSLAQNKVLDNRNPPVVIPLDLSKMPNTRSFSKNIVFLVQEKSFIEPKTGEIQFKYLDNLWIHILPYGNLSLNFININLRKLLPWNWKNKKIRWLGNLHDLSIILNFDFMDKEYDWFWHGFFNMNYYIPEVELFGHKFSHSATIKISALPPSSKPEKELDKNKIKRKLKSIITRELSYSFSLSFGTSFIALGKIWSLSFFPISVRISSDLENRKMENILILRHRTFRSDFYVYRGVDFKLSLYMPTILGNIIRMLSSSKISFKSKQCLILYHSRYFNPYKDFVVMYSIVMGLSVMNSCFDIKDADQTDGILGDSYKHSKNVTSFYVRGIPSEDLAGSDVFSFRNNFAIKLNCELRYLILEKMFFNAYAYVFVNNGYADNIANIFKKVHSLLGSNIHSLFKYSGVGILLTIPLIGEFSFSITFRDMLLTVTYGVENQNV